MLPRLKRGRESSPFPSYSVLRQVAVPEPAAPPHHTVPYLTFPQRFPLARTHATLMAPQTYRLRNVDEYSIRAAMGPILTSGQVQQLAQGAVVTGTADDRSKDWGKIQELLEVRGARAVEEEPFLAMCIALAPFYTESKLEKFRAALVWRQVEELEPAERFTRDERFKRRFRGCLAMCRPFAVRGAISLIKLDKLIAWLIGKGEYTYARGFSVTFWALLRHSDLTRLRGSDIEISMQEVLLSIIGGKGREREHADVVKATEARQVLLTAVQVARVKGHARLFEEWEKCKANALIQQFAELDGWDASHKWSVHSLRHGSASHLKRQGVGEAERKQRGRWCDTRITEWYARGS